jgi:hypothetical protein
VDTMNIEGAGRNRAVIVIVVGPSGGSVNGQILRANNRKF